MVVDAGSVVVHIFQGEEWRREVSWASQLRLHVLGGAATESPGGLLARLCAWHVLCTAAVCACISHLGGCAPCLSKAVRCAP